MTCNIRNSRRVRSRAVPFTAAIQVASSIVRTGAPVVPGGGFVRRNTVFTWATRSRGENGLQIDRPRPDPLGVRPRLFSPVEPFKEMWQRIIGRCWCGIINRQGHHPVRLAACDDVFTRSCRVAKGVFDQVINQLPDPVSIAQCNQGIIKATNEPQVGLQGAQGHAVCRILRDLG
jgi:hypothetical protein